MKRNLLASIIARPAVEIPATTQGRVGWTTARTSGRSDKGGQTGWSPTEAKPRPPFGRFRQGTASEAMKKQFLLPVVIIAVIMTGCSEAMPPPDGTVPASSPAPATDPPNMGGTPRPKQQHSVTTTIRLEVQALLGHCWKHFERPTPICCGPP